MPGVYLPRVLGAYNRALRIVFRVGVAMACLSVVAALLLRWRGIKTSRKSVGEGAKEGR